MISGYSFSHNAIKGDFCLKECIQSMLPICDEVVIGEASSDDGTAEMLHEWAKREPKLRIINQPWTQPVRNPRWFVEWINETRKHLNCSFQLTLDADEVLDERGYPMILDAAEKNIPMWFERINYWRNARTVIPHGETCGNLVVRCGPSNLWMPSDEPYPTHAEEPEIRKMAYMPDSPPLIHHYGFLRNTKGMIEKCKVNLVGFFGENDSRMIEAEQHPERPWNFNFKHKKPYLSYNGPQPKHCLKWLKERGAL